MSIEVIYQDLRILEGIGLYWTLIYFSNKNINKIKRLPVYFRFKSQYITEVFGS